jgi:HK97 family phage major capsid protein
MKLHELKAEKADLLAVAQNIVSTAKAANKDLEGPQLHQYNTLMTNIKALDEKITQCESIGANHSGPRVPISMSRDVEGNRLPIFAKGQSVAEYARQQRPDEHNGITLGAMAKAMALGGGSPEVRAALAEGTDSAGGVTVPVILTSQIVDLMRARSTVFQAGAQTLMLETGKATTLTAIASDPVAGWRAENAAVATSDMTFAPITLTPKSLAVIVTASRELIEDSLNLEQALINSLTKSFAAELDRVALIGTGSATEPKGVSKFSGVGSVSMGTNGAALTNYDPFVEALGTLRTANAADPTACILHPRSDQELNLLKDSQNRPLARPQAIADLPFLVTSKLSTTETQGSANTASRAIMGDFTELIVGIRHNIIIEVLREKYADYLQYGFLAHLRADVAVRHAASFCNIVGIL